MFTVFVILALFGALLAIWCGWIEPRKVMITRHRVVIPNLGHPLTAVVIGDIQPNSYHWPASRLANLFETLQRDESPDLVLWLGDYYNAPTDLSKDFLEDNPKIDAWIANHLPDMASIARAMTKLNGHFGNFAILGNHDWAWSGLETRQHLTAHNIKVLQDDVASFVDPRSGGLVQILGYEDISSGRKPNYDKLHAQLEAGAAQICLSHSPDAFPQALGGPSLMLSGHTHGGQIRIPFIGALVLPLEHRQYDRGWFSDRHRKLLVTQGLGTSLPPLRLMCPPEVVVLELIPDTEVE